MSTLRDASAAGDVAGVLAALARGEALDGQDGEGPSALHAAVSAQQVEVVKLLLLRGAKPELVAWSRTPLSVACQTDRRAERTPAALTLISLLLGAGARPDFSPGDERYTPVRIALENANLPVVDALLAAGATLKPAWALAAIEHRALEVLPRFFARCGDALDLDGLLFALAVHASNTQETALAAASLLARGANPNFADEVGATPMHFAAYWRNAPLLAVLVANGGDLERATMKTWWPEDSPKKRGLTPRAVLEENLRFETQQGYLDQPNGPVRPEWESLAAACKMTLEDWLARLSKPGGGTTAPPRAEGRWVPILALVEGQQGPYDLLEAMAGDGQPLEAQLNLERSGAFTLEGCEGLLGGTGTWRRADPLTLELEFSEGDCAGETRTLTWAGNSLELEDESVTWTFDRADPTG